MASVHVHVFAIVKLASPRVNKPCAHQSRACDSRNYRRVIVEIASPRPMEVLHWKFMRRYNNVKCNISTYVIVCYNITSHLSEGNIFLI